MDLSGSPFLTFLHFPDFSDILSCFPIQQALTPAERGPAILCTRKGKGSRKDVRRGVPEVVPGGGIPVHYFIRTLLVADQRFLRQPSLPALGTPRHRHHSGSDVSIDDVAGRRRPGLSSSRPAWVWLPGPSSLVFSVTVPRVEITPRSRLS